MQNSCKTYGKYWKSTEGKNILCTNREIMHLCQVNKIGQYTWVTEDGLLLSFSKINFFPWILSGTLSNGLEPDQIWVLAVCKGNQQMIKIAAYSKESLILQILHSICLV